MILDNSSTISFILLCLAVLRIYLEIIQFNFSALPLTKLLPETQRLKFHRTGLYFCIGYLILFGPEYLFY